MAEAPNGLRPKMATLSMKKRFFGQNKSQRVEIFDGKKVRRLLNDEDKFQEFLRSEFDKMDADHSGTLSLDEMKPALLRIGKLLGIPPPGTAQETDEMVDGLFASLVSVDLTSEVDRDTFVKVIGQVLSEASYALEGEELLQAHTSIMMWEA